MTTYCLGENCKFRNKSNGMCLWPRECPRRLDIASGLSGYHEPDKQVILTRIERLREEAARHERVSKQAK